MYAAAVKDGVTLAQRYQNRLGKTNNGKNCIRFVAVEVIDLDVFAEAVRDAVAWADRQEEMFGRNCARPV